MLVVGDELGAPDEGAREGVLDDGAPDGALDDGVSDGVPVVGRAVGVLHNLATASVLQRLTRSSHSLSDVVLGHIGSPVHGHMADGDEEGELVVGSRVGTAQHSEALHSSRPRMWRRLASNGIGACVGTDVVGFDVGAEVGAEVEVRAPNAGATGTKLHTDIIIANRMIAT